MHPDTYDQYVDNDNCEVVKHLIAQNIPYHDEDRALEYFSSHKDSESLLGAYIDMRSTLVPLSLASIVTLGDEKIVSLHGKESAADMAFSEFYAECRAKNNLHERLPASVTVVIPWCIDAKLLIGTSFKLWSKE